MRRFVRVFALQVEHLFDTVRVMEAAADDTAPGRHDRPGSADDHELNTVLARLGDRVAPLTMARERRLTVDAPLRDLFVEGGIIRGQVVSCQGAASTSLALALVRGAMVEGSWLAVVDVAAFGVDAADEFGLPLERLVRIDTGQSLSEDPDGAGRADPDDAGRADRDVAGWVEVMGATIDGFDLVVTRPPAALRRSHPASVRKLMTRLRQRGAVVFVLGDVGAVPVDLTVSVTRSVWEGLGRGDGLLRRRRVEVEAAGRRQPGARRCSIELVGGRGGVDLVEWNDPDDRRDDRDDLADPQEQVLQEMRAGLAAQDVDRLAAG